VSRSGRALLLKAAAILFAAMSMRTLFPSASTLLPEIAEALDLSAHATGVLTMLPVFCLGAFAPLAMWLVRTRGADRGFFLVISVMAFALALRALPTVTTLYAGTLLAGAAIAAANVLVPVLVKRDFASRMGVMTALYTTAICGGAAIVSAATVPLSKILPGAWASALGVWAAPAALAAALLYVWCRPAAELAARTRLTASLSAPNVAPTSAPTSASTTAPTSGPTTGTHQATVLLWRQRLAWEVTALMGLQSALAFCIMGWFAPILRLRGMSDVDAGLVVSLLILTQMIGCLAVPGLALRSPGQQWLSVALVALSTVGLTLLTVGPLPLAWFAAVLQGIAQGGLLAIALTIIVLRSPNTQVAAAMSAMAQCVGYMVAALAPALIGVLLPGGGTSAVLGLFWAVSAALLYSGWRAGRAAQLRG